MIPALGGDAVVAIDGKTRRRSTSKAAANPLLLVSAFATDVGLLLGQVAIAEKSNQITAIPELLATLALEGCVVTIDAMGSQAGIAKAILEGGADYVRCVNGSHPQLVESFLLVQAGVGGALTADSTTESREEGYRRTEVRRCRAFDAVDRERTVGTTTSSERRCYISSLPAGATRITHPVRSHWEIENRLRWSVAVQFGEDRATVRTGHAANNLAIVRHIVGTRCACTRRARAAQRPNGCWPPPPTRFGLSCSVW